MKALKYFALAILSSLTLSGCSESNGVDYMNPSPKSGFAINKEVFAAQFSTLSKQWHAPKNTIFSLPITVKNVSASGWSSLTEEQPVQLSYHWLDADKNILIFEGRRTSLKGIVAPGEKQTVNLQVETLPQSGQYILQVTMLQEGVAWFEQQYVTPLELKINIDSVKP